MAPLSAGAYGLLVWITSYLRILLVRDVVELPPVGAHLR